MLGVVENVLKCLTLVLWTEAATQDFFSGAAR